MTRLRHFVAPAFMVAALAAPALSAQTQVVVTDLSSPAGWHQVDTKAGSIATAAITNTYARSGNGSLEFSGFSGGDKDYEGIYFAPQSLGNVTSLSYDWLRSSTSTVSSGLQPGLHLLITNAAHTQFSSLVWEQAYNGGGNAATDQWVSVNAVGGNFWRSMGGPTSTNCVSLNQPGNSGAQETTTLANWISGCYSGDALVYGVSTGFGSGWNGAFNGAVDNVRIGFGEDAGTNYNFETAQITTTPEPSSIALLGTGLFGLIPMVRRRRNKR